MTTYKKDFFPALQPVSSNSGFKMENYWVWCGSAVKEEGKGYHLYAARWGKDYPMLEGYVFNSHIVHAFSETLEGPYRFVENVLPEQEDPARWDGRMTHNPVVVKYKDEYLLYYIGSTYDGSPTPAAEVIENRTMMNKVYDRICIGVARSDSPSGKWKTLSRPVLMPRADKWDNWIVTNPAPCVHPDGRIFLYYRSNSQVGPIGLAIYHDPEGEPERFDMPVFTKDMFVEDPFVWFNGEYFEMIAKDLSGKLTGEYHAGAHFVSDDGIHWEYTHKAYSRNIVLDGKTITLGSLERPQLLFDESGNPEALFAAVADGPGGFSHAENTWNQVFRLK
ncbi:MAG: glycoside hydrolase family protein [Lentisphaeria bacterium]|nr:glycoside hydrolase family protein [Lentisphaeria bacterium]